MARWTEPTQEQFRAWQEWNAERPEHMRAIVERFEPWSLYRMKTTGHRVTIYSFAEGPPVTLTVNVTGDFNHIAFDRQVFGVSPDDLEECDLPGPNEPLGTSMSQDEAEDNIDALRVMVRPDLWELDDSGKAVRKK